MNIQNFNKYKLYQKTIYIYIYIYNINSIYFILYINNYILLFVNEPQKF